MRQQINLYEAEYHPQLKQFSARTALGALGIVTLALALIAGYAAWQVTRLNTSAALVREQHDASEQRLAQSQAIHDEHANPVEVDARIKRLSSELATRTQALSVLQSGAAGETSGFAARLEALARRHVEGVWLNRMEFAGGTGAMNLSGAALSADLVPLYLRSLSDESVLTGARFDEFVIERPDEKEHPNEPLQFRAVSAALPDAKKDEQT